MRHEREVIHLRELPSLLWLAITNPAFQARITLQEMRLLGRQRWYWRLRWALWLNSLAPGLLPARRYPPPEQARGDAPPLDDLTYGETPILTAWKLFQKLGLSPGDVVADLGTGIGLPLLVAHLAFGASGVGWEIVPHRLRRAQILAESLHISALQLEGLDFLQVPLPQASVYWLNPTALQSPSWQRLCHSMAERPAGTRSVVLTKTLPAQEWKVLDRETYPFSWGSSEVFLQQRI